MMAGNFKEYNWNDIVKLIYADIGLKTDVDQRTLGEIWCIGGFSPPQHECDTCIRVNKYDKPFSERLKDHVGDSV